MPDLFPCYTGARANSEVGGRSHVQFLEMLAQHKQLNSTKLPGMCAQWLHFFKKLTFATRPWVSSEDCNIKGHSSP